jgi:hypothetical protein
VILSHPDWLKWSGAVDIEVLKVVKPIHQCPSAFCDTVGLDCHTQRRTSILSNRGYTTI